MQIKSSQNGTNSKVQAYRQRMRAQGMRPLQIWVPDTRAESFKAEAQQQCHAVASSPYTDADQIFMETLTAGWDEEA